MVDVDGTLISSTRSGEKTTGSLLHPDRRFEPGPYRATDCLLRLLRSSTSATHSHPTMPRAQDPTQSLLRWGIEHAAPGSLAQTAQEIKDGKRPDLDTAILKAMMGQTDAEKMRECVMVIEGQWVDRDGTGEVKNNSDITPEDRYRAWEDLEMVRPSFPFTRIRQSPDLLDSRDTAQLVEDLDNANGESSGGLV